MAIAFNAAADLGNNGGSTSSLTASYTCGSGSNRLLVVIFLGDIIGGNDDVTGVTYAGTAMSLAVKNTSGNSNDNRFLYEYHLENPASGANNVVISCTNTHYILALAADYTGVKQTAQPDNSTNSNAAAATSITTTLTTVADNCWTALGGPDIGSGSIPTAGAGSTLRTTEGAFKTFALFDSNSAITPAGSTSMTISTGIAAGSLDTVMASFAPFVAAGAATTSYLPLMGCG